VTVSEQCPFPFPELILTFHIYRKCTVMANSALLCFVGEEMFLLAEKKLHSLIYTEISIRWCCILNLTRVICIEK